MTRVTATRKSTIAVIGGASGIGLAVTEALLEAGYDLFVHFWSGKDGVTRIQEMARKYGRQVEFFQANLEANPGLRRLEKKLSKFYAHPGSLQGVIFCAGVNEKKQYAALTDSDYEKNFLINFKVPFFITRSLLFPKNAFVKKGGSIVFIASPNCFLGGSFRNTLYSSSKSALLGLSKCLAKELAPAIRVNVVVPGYIDTKMLREKTDEKVLEKRRRSIPLQRFGEPRDIALLIKFLISEESGYITGQTLQSNGGLILT